MPKVVTIITFSEIASWCKKHLNIEYNDVHDLFFRSFYFEDEVANVYPLEMNNENFHFYSEIPEVEEQNKALIIQKIINYDVHVNPLGLEPVEIADVVLNKFLIDSKLLDEDSIKFIARD